MTTPSFQRLEKVIAYLVLGELHLRLGGWDEYAEEIKCLLEKLRKEYHGQ